MEQQKSLTQQEKALSLFAFIRELNKLKQKIVLNSKEHPLCRPQSSLPADPEHIDPDRNYLIIKQSIFDPEIKSMHWKRGADLPASPDIVHK